MSRVRGEERRGGERERRERERGVIGSTEERRGGERERREREEQIGSTGTAKAYDFAKTLEVKGTVTRHR